jgi:L-cysteine:1D-myo-inositol 2-amino-2-deoxy-alpha-D-glucopyranoside ligase
VFPHHECERAQSESANGARFARLWMHVGMVRLDGEKMSKSLGNLVFASDLLHDYEPAAIRLALLSQHYRSSYEWSQQLIDDAVARLESWRKLGHGDAGLELTRRRLDDDLDTPGVLRALDELVRSGQPVSNAAELLGISL